MNVTGDATVEVDYTNDLLGGLMDAANTLADFYGWADVTEAIKDENVVLTDLQNLVIAQRSVQGTSDFTFQPCSILVGLMQMSEIGVAVIMNALSGQAS
jgi:hypothetical protein